MKDYPSLLKASRSTIQRVTRRLDTKQAVYPVSVICGNYQVDDKPAPWCGFDRKALPGAGISLCQQQGASGLKMISSQRILEVIGGRAKRGSRLILLALCLQGAAERHI